MDTLLVCGLGSRMERSLPELRDLGVRLVVVTKDRNPTVERVADEVIYAYPRSVTEVLSAVKDAGVRDVDGVMSLAYENPPVISSLAEVLGVRGMPLPVAERCTIKSLRTPFLGSNGFRIPRFWVASGAGVAIEETGLDLPVVVKPADLTSSLGVSVVQDPSEFGAAVAMAHASSARGIILVEEYLEGSEHTVEGLVHDGISVVTGFSDRDYREKLAFYPAVYETGDTLPSALPHSTQHLIEAEVQRAVAALQLDNVAFCADVLLTESNDVVLLEVAARMAGSRFGTELVPLSCGARLLPNVARLALGRTIDSEQLLRSNRPQGVALRYFVPRNHGVLGTVGSLDAIRDEDARLYDVFAERELFKGLEVAPYASTKDVLVGVIAVAESNEAAGAVADRTVERLGSVVPIHPRSVQHEF